MQFIADYAHRGVEYYINRTYRVNGMHHRILELNNNTIEYWDSEDDKEVIVLVHGFGAEAKYQWYLQIPFLRKNFRVIMPNLLYFGNSRNDEGHYKVQDQVEMIHDLLSELRIEKPLFMGASYGGLISAEFTRQFDDVQQLVLLGAPIKFMYDEDQERVIRMFDVDDPEDIFVPKDAAMMKKLMHASNGKPTIIPSYFLQPFHQQFYAPTLKEKNQLFRELVKLRDEFALYEYSFDIPVHLIWGDNDPVVPKERAELLKQHFGDKATLDIIENGGHMVNMMKPEKFNDLLNKYL